MKLFFLLLFGFLLYSCNSGKDMEPNWEVKYEFVVFIAETSNASFQDNSVSTLGFESSDSKRAKRLKDFINNKRHTRLKHVILEKYPNLKDKEFKIDFVPLNGEVKDGFKFELYAMEDENCENLLMDYVTRCENEFHYLNHTTNGQIRDEINFKLDSLKQKMQAFLKLPDEERDVKEITKLEKTYTLLLEKKAEWEIAAAGQSNKIFFYLDRRPKKVKVN
ncbi:MAG: hypothetical protein R2799_06410 [Crocinitomicaceae bacterium]